MDQGGHVDPKLQKVEKVGMDAQVRTEIDYAIQSSEVRTARDTDIQSRLAGRAPLLWTNTKESSIGNDSQSQDRSWLLQP